MVTNDDNLVIGGADGVIEFFIGFAPIQQTFRQLAEIFDGLRSDNEVDKGKAVFQIFLCALGGAARNHDLSAGTPGFPPSEPANFRKRPVLCVLPDGTGVDQEDGGFIRILGLDEPFGLQVTAHLVGIRDIHLAPVGAHIKLHNGPLYCIECTSSRLRTRSTCTHSSREEIQIVVEEYLYQAVQRGFREVRIIHGRGIGVQRQIVQSLLGTTPRSHPFPRCTRLRLNVRNLKDLVGVT